MRLYLLYIVTFLSSLGVTAQSDPANMSFPPPDVASLLKFIEKPVSLYNGQTAVNIPLYTVKDGSAEIPISISYNTSGLKVVEESGIIGLGWSLPLGGIIHQQVVGDVDNYEAKQAYNDPRQYLGDADFFNFSSYQMDNAGFQIKSFPLEPGQYYFRINSGLAANLTGHGRKYQPDIYQYNFESYSGKFFIDQFNDSIYQEKQDPKIHFEKITVAGNPGFKAIVPDGTTYIFNGLITRSWLEPGKPGSITYYLSQVVKPDGNIIWYVYQRSDSDARTRLSQTEKIKYVKFYGGYDRLLNETKYEVARLQKIVTTNSSIDLEYSSREDIAGSEKRLTSITISSGNDSRRINFYTSYFIAPTTGNFLQPSLPLDGFDTKRLRLDSVSLEGMPAYKFFYNPIPLPSKRSFAVDYWGYYNGQDDNTMFLPKRSFLNFFSSSRFDDDGAVRATSETHSKACVLEKVKYPSQGELSLEYEPNTFSNYKIPSIQDLQKIGVWDDKNPGKWITDINLESDKTYYLIELKETTRIDITGLIGYGTGSPQDVKMATISLLTIGNDSEVKKSFEWRYTNENEGHFKYSADFPPGAYVVTVNLPDGLGPQAKPFPKPGEVIGAMARAIIYFRPNSSDMPYSKGAGIRVSKVVNTANESQPLIKSYVYSGGILMSRLKYVTEHDFHIVDSSPNSYCKELIEPGTFVSSESFYPISYAAMGAQVGYGRVREHSVSSNDVPSKDYIEYEYKNDQPFIGPEWMPQVTNYTNGLLSSESYINSSGETIKKREYLYSVNERRKFFGLSYYDLWLGDENCGLSDASITFARLYDRFLIGFYRVSSKIVKPNRIKETFQGITTETDLEYNSYGLVTSERQKILTTNKTIETKTRYNNDETLSDYGERFIKNNLPYEKIISVNGLQDKRELFSFSKIGESFYFKDYGIRLPHYNITNHKTYLTTSAVPLEISYTYYDNKIVEVRSSQGPTKVYLWGYKGTRVIGEVIGLSENEVTDKLFTSGSGLVINDRLISNYDNSQPRLINGFSLLRSSISGGAKVTSLTYDILNGITTVTDPNNVTTYYSYDPLGRLSKKKDNNGNILNTYFYHYKTSFH